MYNRVCAIIVSYNGSSTLVSTVNSIINQVHSVVVVDNGSDSNTQEILSYLINKDNMHVIYNKENYGIARALNQGVAFARSRGYKWILTMDQDSNANSDMVDKMLEFIYEMKQPTMVSVAPKIIYQHNLDYLEYCKTSFKRKEVVITSGNLVNLKVFDSIGYFNESLFIDSVDFDFCLRINNKGYTIWQCNEAILFHSLGETKEVLLFGKIFSFYYHSPLRKYYIIRNNIYMIKKYFISNLLYCCKAQVAIFRLIFLMLFFEPNKQQNISSCFKGLFDGLCGKYGSFNERRLK